MPSLLKDIKQGRNNRLVIPAKAGIQHLLANESAEVILIRLFKSIWLKIYSEIEAFFGKRRMEIDGSINEWLQQVEEKLDSVDDKNEVWNHCVLVLAITKDYSNTILQLLNQDKTIQAKVLLRSLAEIILKTCWCIKDSRGNIELYYDKNQRLSKSSLLEQKKLTKRAYEVFNDPIIKAHVQINEDNLSKLSNVKCAPDNAGLCKELFGNDAYQLFYLILFGELHQVVHANLGWIQKLNISDSGEIYEDENDASINKKICIACVYLILEHIYGYYNYDFSNIKSRYERIKNSL